jgi:hypothetical protein
MPRNISFALTTEQFRNRTKTVTRRLRWFNLKAGDILCGVVKGMGLKSGEKVERLGLTRVLSVRREPLSLMAIDPEYGKAEAALEGFPAMDGPQFVQMFVDNIKPKMLPEVTRIEYEYLDDPYEDFEGEPFAVRRLRDTAKQPRARAGASE